MNMNNAKNNHVPNRAARLKVLLVEDDPPVLRTIQTYLSRMRPEITVVTVDNGSDAGVKAAELRPDLIILDIYIPGLNGFQVCKSIREGPELKQVKILAVSGKNNAQTKNSILAAGADDFLGKPFLLGDLEEKIKQLLQHKSNGKSPA